MDSLGTESLDWLLSLCCILCRLVPRYWFDACTYQGIPLSCLPLAIDGLISRRSILSHLRTSVCLILFDSCRAYTTAASTLFPGCGFGTSGEGAYEYFLGASVEVSSFFDLYCCTTGLNSGQTISFLFLVARVWMAKRSTSPIVFTLVRQ